MSSNVPLGIFWDIENLNIPDNKDVSSVVKQIHNFILEKYPECNAAIKYSCSGDSQKLAPYVTEALDKGGVEFIHVNSTAKNAADLKIMYLVNNFVREYGSKGRAVVIIISNDGNMIPSIIEARRVGCKVILVHGDECDRSYRNNAYLNDTFSYEEIVERAENSVIQKRRKFGYLKVSNLPYNITEENLYNRLRQLSSNRGGKPQDISNGHGTIRFASVEDAKISLNRINGKDVFGKKIQVHLLDTESNGTDNNNRRENTRPLVDRHSPENHNHGQGDPLVSIIKGMHTNKDENVSKIIREMVNNWNDDQVNSALIKSVKREGKYKNEDGKVLIFVTATSPEAKQALVQAGAKYLGQKGHIKWENFYSKRSTGRDSDLDSNVSDVSHTSTLTTKNKDSRNEHANIARSNTENKQNSNKTIYSAKEVPDCLKSVIRGLYTHADQDLLKVVRDLISSWKDPEIDPSLVSEVNLTKFKAKRTDGKHNLSVIAISEEATNTLINGAKKYLDNSKEGIKWQPFDNSRINKCKTFIEGLDVPEGHNPVEAVKQIVFDWSDSQINPNLIESVTQEVIDGKLLLVVTATNEKSSKILLNGSRSHLKPETGIKWFFARLSNQKTAENEGKAQNIPPKPMPRKNLKVVANQSENNETNPSISQREENDQTYSANIVPITSKFVESQSFTMLNDNNLNQYKNFRPIPGLNPIKSPKIPFELSLANYNKTDQLAIYITGMFMSNNEKLVIDFGFKTDISLRFEVSMVNKLITRKSRTNGVWSREERDVTDFPFFAYKMFDIIIMKSIDKYVIEVNGQHLCDYHRNDSTDLLSIDGDLTITQLRFAQN